MLRNELNQIRWKRRLPILPFTVILILFLLASSTAFAEDDYVPLRSQSTGTISANGVILLPVECYTEAECDEHFEKKAAERAAADKRKADKAIEGASERAAVEKHKADSATESDAGIATPPSMTFDYDIFEKDAAHLIGLIRYMRTYYPDGSPVPPEERESHDLRLRESFHIGLADSRPFLRVYKKTEEPVYFSWAQDTETLNGISESRAQLLYQAYRNSKKTEHGVIPSKLYSFSRELGDVTAAGSRFYQALVQDGAFQTWYTDEGVNDELITRLLMRHENTTDGTFNLLASHMGNGITPDRMSNGYYDNTVAAEIAMANLDAEELEDVRQAMMDGKNTAQIVAIIRGKQMDRFVASPMNRDTRRLHPDTKVRQLVSYLHTKIPDSAFTRMNEYASPYDFYFGFDHSFQLKTEMIRRLLEQDSIAEWQDKLMRTSIDAYQKKQDLTGEEVLDFILRTKGPLGSRLTQFVEYVIRNQSTSNDIDEEELLSYISESHKPGEDITPQQYTAAVSSFKQSRQNDGVSATQTIALILANPTFSARQSNIVSAFEKRAGKDSRGKKNLSAQLVYPAAQMDGNNDSQRVAMARLHKIGSKLLHDPDRSATPYVWQNSDIDFDRTAEAIAKNPNFNQAHQYVLQRFLLGAKEGDQDNDFDEKLMLIWIMENQNLTQKQAIAIVAAYENSRHDDGIDSGQIVYNILERPQMQDHEVEALLQALRMNTSGNVCLNHKKAKKNLIYGILHAIPDEESRTYENEYTENVNSYLECLDMQVSVKMNNGTGQINLSSIAEKNAMNIAGGPMVTEGRIEDQINSGAE